LVELDLAGNPISDRWTGPEALRLSYSDEQLTVVDKPNLAHSLLRNRRLREESPDLPIFRDRPRQVHPSPQGLWTKQRLSHNLTLTCLHYLT